MAVLGTTFLGALNYFRSSLSGFEIDGKYHNAANLLQPLYSAATIVIPSKKHFSQIWENSPCLQQAFINAKKLLINATELSFQDPDLPLALFCDASDHSIGGVLMQEQAGKFKPLGFFSRHLPVEKASWAVYRKELLAAQASLRYFISEIYGRHCTIYSDHKPLVDAWNGQGFQLHDPVAQRALLEISQFTKHIKHISGINNIGGDYFSRIPPPNKLGTIYQEEVSSIEAHKLQAVSPMVILEEQKSCPEVKNISNGNHSNKFSFGQVKFGEALLLCELTSAQPRPVLPQKLRTFVMKQLHNGLDHAGEKESTRRIA